MERQKWVRLDNASNIFLAASTNSDTKVFRLSAEMAHAVDPVCLQKALDKVYDRYLLYHSVLRRGVFWYYLEMSELRPIIEEENVTPCTALYHFDRKELLFRVLYRKKRIHLEVFHVLSDGTGALWFFEDVLKEYIFLRYPEEFSEMPQSEQDRMEQQLEDSFSRYFRQQGPQNFTEVARSAYRSVVKTSKRAGRVAIYFGKKTSRYVRPSLKPMRKKKRVYRIKGEKTPDQRPRVVELSLPLQQVLPLARQQNVSLMIYLTALFFEAIRKTSPDFRPNDTIVVSVPVNLRQFYTSSSARNFFSTTYLEYTYGQTEDTIEAICENLNSQLKNSLSKEKLGQRLNKLIASEYNPFGRVVLRPIKDVILKGINRLNNRHLTVAISNLGKVSFPERMRDHIQQLFFLSSVARPQFCMISYQDCLTVTFTSPFVDTAIQQAFVRLLSAQGVTVTAAVNQVTDREIEEGRR